MGRVRYICYKIYLFYLFIFFLDTIIEKNLLFFHFIHVISNEPAFTLLFYFVGCHFIMFDVKNERLSLTQYLKHALFQFNKSQNLNYFFKLYGLTFYNCSLSAEVPNCK